MVPGQREPKALLCPPNSASVSTTPRSCPAPIALAPETGLQRRCLHAARCGWPALRAQRASAASCLLIRPCDSATPREGQNVALGGTGKRDVLGHVRAGGGSLECPLPVLAVSDGKGRGSAARPRSPRQSSNARKRAGAGGPVGGGSSRLQRTEGGFGKPEGTRTTSTEPAQGDERGLSSLAQEFHGKVASKITAQAAGK